MRSEVLKMTLIYKADIQNYDKSLFTSFVIIKNFGITSIIKILDVTKTTTTAIPEFSPTLFFQSRF